MNKTVNINLAGTFFHIDENAFGKLSRYLTAIKKSISDPQGSDEIIRDIEARIAELFTEKLDSASQVVTINELDQVIKVMGQPEDYMVDEEIFQDTPPKSSHTRRSGHKQLFRDIDNKFISGVSSGLSHYLGIDSIWVRLIWILLTVFSSGFFIIVYILFWILVPAAESTSDKLKMTGEAINISNIERKFKEGYDNVADKVKNADYDKYGDNLKKSSAGFFDTLGKIIVTLFTVFVKFLGILLIFVSLTTLVALIVSLFTFGSVGWWGSGEVMDYITMVDTTNTPIWIISLLSFFAIGIPFFVLFILGLKMLINNLKSIGTPAKIALFAVWVLSLAVLGTIAIKQATEQAYDGEQITEHVIPVSTGETLTLSMRSDSNYDYEVHRHGGLKLKYNEADQQVIYSNDIRLIVRSSKDSIGKLVIEKNAEGKSYLDAKNRAEAIDYGFTFENGTLMLDGFFTTETENKYRDQEIQAILYLPEGTILIADETTYSFHRNDSRYDDILNNGDEGKQLLILKGKTECIDCPTSTKTTDMIERTESTRSSGSWEQEVNQRLDGNTFTPEEESTIIETEIEQVVPVINDSINNFQTNNN